jgi:CBS domain-containing protein
MRKILSRKVSQIMRKRVVTLGPDDPISQVRKFFKKYHYYAFPVVDDEDNFLGLVSKIDFLKIFSMGVSISRSKFYNLFAKNVSEIMVKIPDTVNPDARLIDVVDIMVEYNYRTIPVVNKKNKLVGIVTSSDITKYTLLEAKKK